MTSQRHDRHTHQCQHQQQQHQQGRHGDRRSEGILVKKTPPELHLDRTEKHHRKQSREGIISKQSCMHSGSKMANGTFNNNNNGTRVRSSDHYQHHHQQQLLQLHSPPSSPPPTRTPSPVAPLQRSLNGDRQRPRLTIPRLQRSDWVNLEGLVSCAVAKLGKTECTAISELGRGSHNSLYELQFSDGTSCAASISNSPPSFFSVAAKESEIATMQYLSSSPSYNIPVPRVYAWDLSFDNPVGAPYILREVVHGKNMSEDGRFYRLSPRDKLKVIKELAYVQAELSKPAEFDKIGCIYRRKDSEWQYGEDEFYVGKLISLPSGSAEEDARREDYLGPFDSLPELWEARIDRETLSAIDNWADLPSDSAIPSMLPPSKANPQEFGVLLQILSGLISLFTPPKELSTLCIHHSDLAIRNVLFDEKSLKITGVIDWEFATVMPLVATGRFPNDLGWEGNEFARSLGKLGNVPQGEVWNHHYYDWTSLNGVAPPSRTEVLSPPDSPASMDPPRPEDYLTTPNATANGNTNGWSPQMASTEFESEGTPSPPSPPLPPPPTCDTPQQEINNRASNLVKLFYYRKYYASRLGARNFGLTRLFIDSVAYIKFNEIIMGGSEKWFLAAEWIKEVFWRLQKEDQQTRESLMEGRGVVRVPEVLHRSPDRAEVDLGGPERMM